MRGLRSPALRRKRRPAGASSSRRFFRFVGLLSFALLGCDRGSPILDRVETGPKVKVQLTIPEADAVDVPLDQSIRIQFDRFLSPLSVFRQSICIAAVGPTTRASGRSRCEQFPAPEYDPVDRVAVWKPSQPLEPGVRYTVLVRPPESDNDLDGIRAFDGAPLVAPHVFAFTTERRAPCTTDSDCRDRASCHCEGPSCSRKTCRLPVSEPQRHIDYCYDSPRLCTLPPDLCRPPSLMPMTTAGPRKQLNGCAENSARCHAGGGDTGLSREASPSPLGSELSLAHDGIRNVLGKVALETATLANPTAVNRLGIPFAVNMPYVDPGFPANSYLLWKLVLGMQGTDVVMESARYPDDGYRCEDLPEPPLVDGGADDSCPGDAGVVPLAPPVVRAGEELRGAVEPWIPPELSQPIAEGEYERLRRSLRGGGMPYGGRISPASIRTISAWIAEGAPVPECR